MFEGREVSSVNLFAIKMTIFALRMTQRFLNSVHVSFLGELPSEM